MAGLTGLNPDFSLPAEHALIRGGFTGAQTGAAYNPEGSGVLTHPEACGVVAGMLAMLYPASEIRGFAKKHQVKLKDFTERPANYWAKWAPNLNSFIVYLPILSGQGTPAWVAVDTEGLKNIVASAKKVLGRRRRGKVPRYVKNTMKYFDKMADAQRKAEKLLAPIAAKRLKGKKDYQEYAAWKKKKANRKK